MGIINNARSGDQPYSFRINPSKTGYCSYVLKQTVFRGSFALPVSSQFPQPAGEQPGDPEMTPPTDATSL
jgi:hypothetical protein